MIRAQARGDSTGLWILAVVLIFMLTVVAGLLIDGRTAPAQETQENFQSIGERSPLQEAQEYLENLQILLDIPAVRKFLGLS